MDGTVPGLPGMEYICRRTSRRKAKYTCILYTSRCVYETETKLSDKEIKLRARMKGINLCCLSEFCIGEKELYRHVLVLNYSGLEQSRMLEVAGVLGEIFV